MSFSIDNLRNYLVSYLYLIPAILICLSIHEYSHGLAAYRLGDYTAKNDGRLSLNPIRHIEPLGLLCLLVFRFGWGKPVQVNYSNLKNPRRDIAIVALAGPVSNFILSFILLILSAFVILLPSNSVMNTILTFLLYTTVLSAGLGVFNLIPVPPLDGSKVLFSLIKADISRVNKYSQYIQILFLVLLFLGYLYGPIAFLRHYLLRFLSQIVIHTFALFKTDVSVLETLLSYLGG